MNARARRPLQLSALVTVTALALSGCVGSGGEDSTPSASADCIKDASLTIKDNSIAGGKNAAKADWIVKTLIPAFQKAQKADGNTVAVKFEGDGNDDEAYKTKISLDLKTGSGADVVAIDGIWVGEFAEAGYIKPVADVAGPDVVDKWEGWSQIPETVQGVMKFNDKNYGIPQGTDGRVIFYNKKVFAAAGLPADWQPTSWAEIISAAEKLKAAGVPIPIQLNAGTAMGEATSMQGALPLLVGTGKEIYTDGKWLGDTPELRAVLQTYADIYGSKKLGDPLLQQEEKGRDKSFTDFAKGEVGILLEGDYFWRGVIEPKNGSAPMATRDADVGYVKIPAEAPGKGVKGQDFVSMSGGGGSVLNPKTKCPAAAWALLSFMSSKDMVTSGLQGDARLTARQDVNDEVLKDDPMLSFIANDVVPITATRPGLALYPQVSMALQEATGEVASGTSVDAAAKKYQAAVEKIAGKENVATG